MVIIIWLGMWYTTVNPASSRAGFALLMEKELEVREVKRRVIDKRVKEKFQMDDAYLNGMARRCGWQSTLVYMCLCRHSDKEQESFPSIKFMQDKLGVGRNTVIKGIRNLEKFNVVHVGKERTKNGKWQNNVYVLIDKSEWLGYQVPDRDTAPCPRQNTAESLIEQTQVPHRDTKDTHIKDTHRRIYSPSASFETFWNLYPKKVEKKKSSMKWERLDEQTRQIILEDLPKRTKGKKWLAGFVENPTTYLNGERWNDVIEVEHEYKPEIFELKK